MKKHKVKSKGITPAGDVESTESEVLEMGGHSYLPFIGTMEARSVKMSEIREYLYEQARQAVREAMVSEVEAFRQGVSDVLSTPTGPFGADVPDQGSPVAPDPPGQYQEPEVEIVIRAKLNPVGPSYAHIERCFKQQLQYDWHDEFPWFEMIDAVTISAVPDRER